MIVACGTGGIGCEVDEARWVAGAVRAVFGSVVLSAARAVFARAAVGVWRLCSVTVVGAGWRLACGRGERLEL